MLTFYPLKNNRLAISLGPAPSRRSVDYKKELPFGRSFVALGFVGAFLVVFGGVELKVLGETINAWNSVEQLFDLTGAVFLSCWLLGWSIGVVFLLFAFVVLAFGRGLLLIYQGRVEVLIGIPGLGAVIRQEASEVTTIELVNPDARSIFPKEGKQLLISDGSPKTTSPLGSNMTQADVIEVRSAVNKNKHKNANLDPIDNKQVQSAHDKELVEQEATLSGSVLVLVLANLAPLIGALVFGWEISQIMVLYWLETAVILLYQITKYFVISPVLGVVASIFSLASVGAFMAIHFLFIWSIFVEKAFSAGSLSGSDLVQVFEYIVALWPALAALIFSHGYSFFANFWPRRDIYRARKLKVGNVMSRVVLMHVTIIFGGFLVAISGSDIVGVSLLIVSKIAVDVMAHRKYHKVKLGK